MSESFDPQPLMAMLGVAVFALVWLGLATSIRKISRRQQHPPSFNALLNAAHLGRFAGWALVGAATLRTDYWTGVMLLSTRIPAVALVAVTFLQRRRLRPSRAQLARTLVPLIGALSLLCGLIALCDLETGAAPDASGVFNAWGVFNASGVFNAWEIELPQGTPASYAANALVLACFAVQIFYALPQQLSQARTKPLGNLRWFQMGLLANYGYTLLYSFVVQDALVRLVMRGAYLLVFVEQAMLVFLIERAIRRRKLACSPSR